MKKITSALVAILIATTCSQVNALGVRKKTAKESLTTVVTDEVSTLTQIAEQAGVIVDETGSVSEAKSKINQLMRKLDPETRKIIANDIKIITTNKDKNKVRRAYERLVGTVNNMDAQANVVVTTENARVAIEAASADMKQEVIAQQTENVQSAEAEAAQASLMNRVISGVKTAAAMPGDYLFGKEQSTAKDRFNAAIGAVATAGAAAAVAYGAYQMIPEGTAAKWAAKGKRFAGQELSVQEKAAAGEQLSWWERMKLREQLRTEAIETEQLSRRAAAEREMNPSWFSTVTGSASKRISEVTNKAYEFYYKARYGMTPGEARNIGTATGIEAAIERNY